MIDPETTTEDKRLTYGQLRHVLTAVGDARSEWAGLPMPVEGMELVMEKRYPWNFKREQPEDPDSVEIVNRWFSRQLRCEVVLARDKDGRPFAVKLPFNQGAMLLQTMFASIAWSVEAESKATVKLGQMLRHNMFRSYLMTGCFIETSKRSGVTYMFRKLRPTLAIRPDGDGTRMIAALCLHPIGYYAGSWAGAMCPTDCVIAHLALMRGDEHDFWRQANQHPVTEPQSGL
jgi:hypothetical protein